MSVVTIVEERHEVFVDGRRVHLAPKELGLFSLLRKTNKTMTRRDIFMSVWKQGTYENLYDRVIDQHVARLRRKVGAKVVETVTGVGYRIAPGV